MTDVGGGDCGFDFVGSKRLCGRTITTPNDNLNATSIAVRATFGDPSTAFNVSSTKGSPRRYYYVQHAVFLA